LTHITDYEYIISMSDNIPALAIKSMTKRYDAHHGVFDIDLTVQRGEIFGFLGPNGAGKSTTINTVLDILRPTSGTIEISGLDHHKHAKYIHSHIGYLSGDMETDPTLSGRQYLKFVANLHRNIDKQRVEQLVERLKADITTKIKHLSRGSKQKIGLIAALMQDPELLILDEPTSGLDPLIQAEFNEIIRDHKERGKTAFISSHILNEVQTMCDRVGFIRDGQLVAVSTLQSLLQKAPRQIRAQFKDVPPLEQIQTLKGISDLRHDDGLATFLFKGDVNQLLALLSKHQLKSLSITETDLEELFMNYYKSKEAANV
jgi:ABC-2 type transport system ATP-binding protein